MTPIDRFERQLPSALAELADERTPDYLIDILGRTARTRQRSAWTHPGRWLTMPGPAIRPAVVALAAAVLVAVIGGGILLTRSNDNGVGRPSTAPSTAPLASPSAAQSPDGSPSASPAGASIAEVLRSKWVAPARDVAGLTPRSAFHIIFGPTSFSFPTGSTSPGDLASDASTVAPDRIQLVSLRSESGCQAGDTGIYAWTLSPSGRRLSISAQTDTCATRRAALSGDWARIKCTDPSDDCYGDLDAGTFATQFIDPRVDPGSPWSARYGAIEFAVPDGWANSGDWPETFDLETSDVYALESPQGAPVDIRHGVSIVAQPAAVAQTADCTDQLAPAVHRTVGALIDWLGAQPSLVVSTPKNVTVDGHDGQQVDVTLASTWTATCGAATPTASVVGYARGGPDDWVWMIQRGERQRLTLLDLGGGDVVMVAIDSTYPDRWADLLSQAAPIVESLHFR